VTKKDTKLLTAAFCAGLLERALDADVNIVNSEVLLRERGIELTQQSRSEMGAFSSAITAEVVSDNQAYTAGGTLFGNNMPRLFRLADYRLEAYMDGILLIFTHDDVPGIIGCVGTIFGRHNVNIAQMAVGRAGSKPGGGAIGVLNLDSLPPQAAIDEMLSHSAVHSVKVIEMPQAGQLPPWLQ
jgi:D-3-phosphoglycerate dehydrogenase